MYELLIAIVPSSIAALVSILVMRNKNKTNLELAEKDHQKEIGKYKVELEKQAAEHQHALELKGKEHQYEMEKIEHQANVQSKSNNDNQISEAVMKVFSGEFDLGNMENLAAKANNSPFYQPNKKPKRKK